MSMSNIKKHNEEELIKLTAKYACDELSYLWTLTAVGDKTGEEFWKERALVFEEMIKILSPKHAELAKIGVDDAKDLKDSKQ